jgi:hypothetical protein
MPLYYGHPFLDFGRFASQLSTLFAFFFFLSSIIAGISVVSYSVYRMKLLRIEGEVFIFTFCVAFITLNAILVFISAYWGNTIGLPFPTSVRDSYFLFLGVFVLALWSSAPAVISVLIYEVYRLARKWR